MGVDKQMETTTSLDIISNICSNVDGLWVKASATWKGLCFSHLVSLIHCGLTWQIPFLVGKILRTLELDTCRRINKHPSGHREMMMVTVDLNLGL